MRQFIYLVCLYCCGMLACSTGNAQNISYDTQLFRAQLDLKKACERYDKAKAVFDRIETKRLENQQRQNDLREAINAAGNERERKLFNLVGDRSISPEEFNRATAQARESARIEIDRLNGELRTAVRTEWTEFGEPYREVREDFVFSKIIKDRAVENLEKIKQKKPGRDIIVEGEPRPAGPGDDPAVDEEIKELLDLINRLAQLQDPSSPRYVPIEILENLEIQLDSSIDRTEEISRDTERFNEADIDGLRFGTGTPVDADIGGPGRSPPVESIDPVFDNPLIAPPPEGFLEAATQPPVEVDIDFEIGAEILNLPDYGIGVVDLGTDSSPLHEFDNLLIGPGVDIGIEFGQRLPGPVGNRWFGRIEAGFAIFDDSDKQTIPSFPAGQAPTYIDITGGGGFALNANSIVRAETDVSRFGVNGKAGWETTTGSGLTVAPFAGAFLHWTEIESDVSMNTDFGPGQFQNTLSERLRTNQFGANVGLDLTYRPQDHLAFTFGGHAGLAFTDTSYKGSDCGDGNPAVAGCNGTLFSNSGISHDQNSVDLFGGLKAAVSFYLFCRSNSAEIAAGAIAAAANALRSRCAEISATASYDALPSTKINRPTSLGATGIRLSSDYMHSAALSLRARFPLAP